MVTYEDLNPDVQKYMQEQNKIFVFVNFGSTKQKPWLSFVRANEFPEAWKLNMTNQAPVSFVQYLAIITVDDLLTQTGPLGTAKPMTMIVKEPEPVMTEPEHLASYLRDHGYTVLKNET